MPVGCKKEEGPRLIGALPWLSEYLSGNYTLRVLKMRMRVTITRMAPIAMMTQTHSGVAGSAGAGAGGAGAGSVWKLNVADQSDGMFCPLTSRAFTRQK